MEMGNLRRDVGILRGEDFFDGRCWQECVIASSTVCCHCEGSHFVIEIGRCYRDILERCQSRRQLEFLLPRPTYMICSNDSGLGSLTVCCDSCGSAVHSAEEGTDPLRIVETCCHYAGTPLAPAEDASTGKEILMV